MRPLFYSLLVACCLIGPLFSWAAEESEPPLVVAVAANFARAAQDISTQFERQTGVSVRLVVGSTGLLFAQITQGASVDVFLAADRERPSRLAALQSGNASIPVTYTRGQLAFWWPSASDEVSLFRFLQQARVIAIANPMLAPYGLAAQTVLNDLGAPAVGSKLVLSQNIGTTFSQISAGSVDGGFVALTQLLAAGIPDAQYLVIPEEMHPPILQAALVTATGARRANADAFLAFLISPSIQAQLAQWGYGAVEGSG